MENFEPQRNIWPYGSQKQQDICMVQKIIKAP